MPRPSTRSLTSSHLNSSNLFSAAGCRWMMRLAVVATVGGLVASEAGAALYFDVNGTDAGSGAVNGATYTWNSASNALWNTDSGGAGGTLSGFTSGESAVFAAGTDSTGAYAVTVAAHAASPTAAQLGNVAGITVQEGGWTFGGDPIRLTAGSVVEVQSGASATFSGGLRGVAAGTYTFRNNGGTTTNWGQYLRNGAGQTHNVIFEGSGDGTVNLANIGTGSITKNGGGTLAISNRSN
jgi:fibronectin-binding autotransporter adhesin